MMPYWDVGWHLLLDNVEWSSIWLLMKLILESKLWPSVQLDLPHDMIHLPVVKAMKGTISDLLYKKEAGGILVSIA